jgi:hypothetical protein
VRLLALRLKINAVGEALIQQPGDFDSALFGKVDLGPMHQGVGGNRLR